MSFAFSAAGRPDEIVRQVRSHHIPGEAEGLAHKVRDLITETFRNYQPRDDENYFFVVKASGHAPERPGDYGAVSVQLTIEPIWIPRMREPAEEAEVLEGMPRTIDENTVRIHEALNESEAGRDATDLGIGL